MRTVFYAPLMANGYFGRATDGRTVAPEVLSDFGAHGKDAGT